MSLDARAPLPPFHDDLAAAWAELWRLLADGVARGRSAFHTPSLATLGEDGRPRVRTVVLRAADPEAALLRIHCDRRSDKAREVLARAPCALHAYDPESKVQIRIEGRASLHAEDDVAEAAWAASQPMSRVCYAITPAPGTALARGGAYAQPDPEAALVLGRPNFCALRLRAERLDFLYLDRRGHRRAGWTRGAGGWSGTWLAP
ncbi:pyridoxamine 5'-phosphate oxidase family protein [Methylobacterium soli]|uniref:Pyridoxamine 5'-phosphate oxidase n=1 Tax=Methylobacterium soli TaxID=553447 RepID=A0A6L3SY18_9HYPH|nr:pyridoxamine 5'-phosphate oxidase family protein [Methylobacterium soli]KAB1078069.1 pyridoxamine 5'-phosphate oxidase [Methylobacterium soli]GJE43038.1 Pyridoxine/pyridoxamine 5'-phosphate oxidase [Methylobacterium soli]